MKEQGMAVAEDQMERWIGAGHIEQQNWRRTTKGPNQLELYEGAGRRSVDERRKIF